MNSNDQRVALVVVEAGARWPSYSRELAGRASSAVVESQPSIESAQEFAARVVGRVARLSERTVTVPLAIFAVSQRIDPDVQRARHQIARAVVSTMAALGGGELLVMGDEHFSDEVRHQMLALAGSLCDDVPGRAVSVRVRFGQAEGARTFASPRRSSRAAFGE